MEVPVTCLCGAAKQTVKLEATKFPIEEEICHCNPCRTSSGSVGGIFLTITQPADVTKLEGYETSKKIIRYFCPTCGSHMFAHVYDGDLWSVGAGCVDIPDKKDDLVKIIKHAYVGDTKDGGWAGWLLDLGGRDLPTYEQDATDSSRAPVNTIKIEPAPVGKTPFKEGDDRVLINCHCGGVECYLHRSTTEDKPYTPGMNMMEATWWLCSGGKKYRAGMCPCRSCRIWIGQPLQPWAFCEEKDIRDKEGNPVDFEKNWGTLKTYNSSPNVYRHFCSKCGAKVFYRAKDRAAKIGKEVIDISIGVIRADTGVRAENWLEWEWNRMGYKDEGLEKEIIGHLLSKSPQLVYHKS